MSEVQSTPAPVVADPVASTAEASAVEPLAPTSESAAVTETPLTEAAKPEAAIPTEESATATPAALASEEVKPEEQTSAAVEEKTVEPISEGQLAYKGPGLVKSLIPSKKEFWLSDAAVTPSQLDLYLRGEKAEIGNPVVAWASQTGKGLLFFNKKGETSREHPGSILALYDAADLKKESVLEIVFKLNHHQHTLKAATEAERDGWYFSLEKAVEIGKSQKETVRESEGYKAEIEKLSKPNVIATGGRSAPKKSTEAAAPAVADEEAKKTQKSRSTSRGVLGRLKGKKEELVEKKEENKEEKAAEKEEGKTEETAEPAADDSVAAAAVVEPTPAATSADAPAIEPLPLTEDDKVEEKPKVTKRSSVFGKIPTWVKSPSKEKSENEAELKPEVPPKDAGVSETAPQIPEPTAETAAEPVAPAVATTEPDVESKPVEAAKDSAETTSPSDKKGFLSGLFTNKRNRSVSPSTTLKDAPKKEETPAVPAATTESTETPVVAEPVITDATAPVEEPVVAVEGEKTVEEPAKTETTTANKRQSVLGSLGRRASKALNRIQAPKKENVAPTSEATKEEAVASEAAPSTETPAVNGETKVSEAEPQSIGDVIPDAVNIGQPQATATTTPVVTASA